MRVVFVAAPLTARSGVYRSAREIVAEGRRQGHEWSLLLGVSERASGTRPTGDPEWIVERPLEPAGLGGIRRLRGVFLADPQIAAADLVVSLIPQADMALATTGIRWVAYLRGLPWPEAGESGAAKTLLWRRLELLALRRAEAIWATTQVLLAQTGLGDSVRIVPAGITPVDRRWNGRGPRTTAVWAARYDDDKNPGLFQRVLAGTPLEGVMYGGGHLEGALVQDAPPNVSVRGWVAPADLWTDALAYVGTSHREAFGRSAVEAAMSGIPVVLADSFGAAPLLVTDPGFREAFVLPVSEPARWVDALALLAADEELRGRYSDHVHANALRLGMAASVAGIADAIAALPGRDRRRGGGQGPSGDQGRGA